MSSSHHPKYRLCCLLLCFLCVSLGGGFASAADEMERYFSGLRERGLWVIAEDYALSQLRRPKLSLDQRMMLNVELARTLVDHGAVISAQREELWAEADRTLIAAMQAVERSDESQLTIELALLKSQKSEVLAWESLLAPENLELNQNAQQQTQEVIQVLQTCLQKKLAESGAGDRLSQEVRLELGKSYVRMAELLLEGQKQTRAWSKATETLQPLSKSTTNDELAWKSQLLRARISRATRDFLKAQAFLDDLFNKSDFTNYDDALVEQIHLLIDKQNVDEALNLTRSRLQENRQPTAALKAAIVDALISAWKFAKEKGDEDLQKSLLVEANRMHQQIAGKWRQWTHVKLKELDENTALGEELALVVRAGRAAYHRGDLEQAVKDYTTAVGLAYRSQQVELALEYAMTRASILLTQQRWEEASLAYQDIVERYPSHSQAGQADLLNCYVLGRWYAGAQTQLQRENYEAALKRHLQEFPSSATTPEAIWMLATHYEQRLQWTDALGYYKIIPQKNVHFDEACVRITILLQNIIARLRELDGPAAQWEDQAVQEIERLSGLLPGQPARWNVTQCQTGLHCAQLLLQHRSRLYALADAWLTRINQTIEIERTLARREETSVANRWNELSQIVSQLRIVSLAGQQKLTEASQLLNYVGTSDPVAMLGVVQGLSEIAGKIDPQQKRELGKLQEQAVKELTAQRDQLTPEQQLALTECMAEAYVALGDLPEAAEVYEALLKNSPGDKRLIHKVIAVYVERGQSADLGHAKQWWTKIERLEKPGTPRWIKARVEVAKLMIQLNEAVAARKLLGVTKTLYPQLGTPEMAAEVERLLE